MNPTWSVPLLKFHPTTILKIIVSFRHFKSFSIQNSHFRLLEFLGKQPLLPTLIGTLRNWQDHVQHSEVYVGGGRWKVYRETKEDKKELW
ncbi:MAG: hypothetical protein COS40_11795 [Deltaproteobacteria bacterium CG03_land_8_20_14_0_80_45_14]|nr:MAG: hypothetical protein COS40_11795 [Deltaproteobacteria bacterium CG03_land_8_20_14_0_80_45_14]